MSPVSLLSGSQLGRSLLGRSLLGRSLRFPTTRAELVRTGGAIGVLVTLTLELLTAPLPPTTAIAPRWDPPLGQPLRIEVPFRAPPHPYAAGHRGIDLPASGGESARSPADGVVSFAGTVGGRPVISIRTDPRTVLSLDALDSELHAGDPVQRGEPLGTVAAGGHCDGHCLHLGVRVDGEYVNPLRYLRARPVLLPWR